MATKPKQTAADPAVRNFYELTREVLKRVERIMNKAESPERERLCLAIRHGLMERNVGPLTYAVHCMNLATSCLGGTPEFRGVLGVGPDDALQRFDRMREEPEHVAAFLLSGAGGLAQVVGALLSALDAAEAGGQGARRGKAAA